MAEQNSPLPSSLAGAPPQQWIAAPSPIYLTGEESLRITTISSIGSTLTVGGRVLTPANSIAPIEFKLTTNSNRTQNVGAPVGLSEGWLLGFTIRATVNLPSFGQIYVIVELVRGTSGSTDVLQTLAAGFVTGQTPMFWPGGLNVLPLDGPGNLRSITGSTPAAGADISETVPTGARWELLSFRGTLVTNATVSNRAPTLTLDDGANSFGQFAQFTVITASISSVLTWGAGAGQFTSTNIAFLTSGLPVGNRLPAAARIRTATANLQAGDQWSAVQYLVREWMTGE